MLTRGNSVQNLGPSRPDFLPTLIISTVFEYIYKGPERKKTNFLKTSYTPTFDLVS
jgi:hypothetical protein